MKKYFCILFVLPVLLLAPPFPKALADDLFVIEDVDDPDGLLTSVTLAWDANAESNIAGYNIYYGRASGEYLGQFPVTRATATFSVRGSRQIYFAVTAVTTDGLESPFSGEVRWP